MLRTGSKTDDLPPLAESCRAASETLERLVGFVAAAFHTRYAFVACVVDPQAGSLVPRRTFWLAKDYGLRRKFTQLELRGDSASPCAVVESLTALRQTWPDERELEGLTEPYCWSETMRDRHGLLLGHLGMLDPDPSRRVHGLKRLPPLARLAETELLSWLQGARPPE